MPNRKVPVDEGDLMEACDAANAWAAYLRYERNLHSAADRVDSAVARLRKEKPEDA